MLGPPFVPDATTRPTSLVERTVAAIRAVDVSERVGLVLCPEARIYDHGPQHPLRPERVLLTWELIEAYGLDRLPNVGRLGCEPADRRRRSSSSTRRRSSTPRRARGTARRAHWGRFGYGPGDNPIFDDMHEAGAFVVGATVAAARAVWSGEAEHAFNAAGGLHHAMPDRASGFCVYDDPAVGDRVAARAGRRTDRLRRRRRAPRRRRAGVLLERPAGAHGLDPRVRARVGFFPGTGGLDERGGPDAEGSARERARSHRGRATTRGSTRSARSSRRWSGGSRRTSS